MELDRVASERVIANIKKSVPSRWAEKAAELRALAKEQPGISLGGFLKASGLELHDVYAGNRSWSDLMAEAGLATRASGPDEEALRRACGRLFHVDDAERLDTWRAWLKSEKAPKVGAMTERERRLLKMLVAQLLNQVDASDGSLTDEAKLLWKHPQVRAELVELFDVLAERVDHITVALDSPDDVPLRSPARYTRLEMLAACGLTENAKIKSWREGVYFAREVPADLFAFTLDKTKGQFSPTTRYRDYAISRELIHWESQSMTRAESPTGLRYQQHVSQGSQIFLFGRLNVDERAFYFLGPATYVSHRGEMPMGITWRLKHPLPGDLFQVFGVAVA